MNIDKAKQFVQNNARPLDLAVYHYFFEDGTKEQVIKELEAYQNPDGGFGHGIELDYLNPNSTPIATNDAIITLARIDALDPNLEMVKAITKYLSSHDSFHKSKRRWLFAVDSNRNFPHAIWWEKNEGDGISGFNPTMSLAAFMVCYGEKSSFYEEILIEGLSYLKNVSEIGGDALKCFLLAYTMLKKQNILDVIDLNELKNCIIQKLEESISEDFDKYGLEYVPTASDFFISDDYNEFITPKITSLIQSEKNLLAKLQKNDGGFDITWQWYNDYKEFETSKKLWRPRITIDKLLFYI